MRTLVIGALWIVGILGGVASGKSLVAEQLRSLGAEVLDGDRAGHEVLKQETIKTEIARRWGAKVFLPNGEVDRAALARIVFAPTPAGRAELEQLEQITHPAIRRRLEEQLAEMASHGVEVAVLDAPVMVKAGWHKLCNTILFIDAPEERRKARARQRGWDEAEFARREAAQEPLATKRALSSHIIDNSGSPAQTREQIERFWKEMIPRDRPPATGVGPG